MPVESSDLIMLATKSPLITMSPEPFGSIIISVFVKEDEIIFPLMSIDFPVESCPMMSYNSSKLLLAFIIAARSVSPSPVFVPDPTLILCFDILKITLQHGIHLNPGLW